MVTTGGRGASSSGRLLDLFGFGLRRVLVLPHRLEAERGRDQLDLVEVEPLVHGHHQAQLLERELDDLGGGHLHRAGELGDRDELVHPDPGLLLLPLLRQAAGLDLAERRLVGAAALAARRALHALERPQDVGLHRVLIHHRALALLALLAAAALLGVGAEGAGRRGLTGPALARRRVGSARPERCC